jgi:thiol-disulfide isomerase/thioredoxin
MADMEGNMHKLSEYVGQGKIVLIDFWASWCPPCRKEMPALVELYKKYNKKGFEIVGVSLDKDKDAWVEGVKNMHMEWKQLSDLKFWESEGAALYGVNSIPHTVLVDKDGTILAKNLHGEELNTKLAELIK